ncbi:MAG: SDR family oxidoreductase [Pirellulaceae bacterium]|nr:SDR family oxidoreductase [Pirellulaceae bacterium]
MNGHNLENRVCLITGGANGIGRATALALLDEGAHVYVADVSALGIENLLQDCAASVRQRLHCRCVDVSDLTEVESWISNVANSHGRVEILVHCAAHADWSRVDDQSIESILQTMRVGFDGMVHCTKTVLPLMQTQNFGRIVYLSSVASSMHLFPGYAAYASLKAATDAWTNMLRIDLRGSSIQIASVRPGVVKETGFFLRSVDRANLPRLFDLLPATTPDVVATTIIKAIGRSNRTYVVPRRYRLLEWTYRLAPQLSRWLCRQGTSRRSDIQTRDDVRS